jgi:hypothetical protein
MITNETNLPLFDVAEIYHQMNIWTAQSSNGDRWQWTGDINYLDFIMLDWLHEVSFSDEISIDQIKKLQMQLGIANNCPNVETLIKIIDIMDTGYEMKVKHGNKFMVVPIY